MNIPEPSQLKINMRPSRVLRKLRQGGVALSYKLNTESARAAEIAALAGFDCIWTDMEHVANDWGTVERQIWAAKTHDADVIVRVARGGYNDYIKPLELDASGIMVPHIMGVEDARNVVRMTRFHPTGLRPVDGGNADCGYCSVDFNDYLAQANQERLVIAQIEDHEPLKDLDAIASLKGIDMLFFGPGDFSQSIGAPGQWNHPRITEARKQIVEVCKAHGKFAGTVGSPSQAKELIAMGYRFLNIGADVISLLESSKQLLKDFRKNTA